MTEDLDLIELFKQGDEDAFEQLILKYRPYILSVILDNKIRGIDFDDLYQECIIVLYKSALSYRKNTVASFHTYYRKAIHNFFCQIYRRSSAIKRKATIYDDEDKYSEIIENYAGTNYANALSPESVCLLKEEFENAYRILNSTEKNMLHNIVTDLHLKSETDKRVYYKCKSKFKKVLTKTCR